MSEPWTPTSPYTRVPHEVLEVIARGWFTGSQTRVLLAIARHSWGFHQVASRCGVRQIAATCQMHPSTVSRVIRSLEERRVVQKEHAMRGQQASIRIVEQVRLWQPPAPRKPRKLPQSVWKPKMEDGESVDLGVNTSPAGSVDLGVNRGVDLEVNGSVDLGVNTTKIYRDTKDRRVRGRPNEESPAPEVEGDAEVVP